MSGEVSPVLLPEFHAEPIKTKTAILRTQLLCFLAIGGTSVAIDLAVYLLLLGTFGKTTAKAISYVAGMLFGFVGNKYWTFESRRASAAEPAIYVLLYAFTLAVNVGLNALSYELVSNAYAAGRVSQIVAFLIATGTTTVLNFIGLKYLTFRAGGHNVG